MTEEEIIQHPFGTHSSTAGVRAGTENVDITFSTMVYNGTFNEHTIPEEKANDVSSKALILRGSEKMVELEDYIAANTMSDCRAWFLWGRVVSPTNDYEEVIVYAIFKGTEEECIAMIGDVWVSGWISTVTKHVTFVNKEKRCVISAFMGDIKTKALKDVLNMEVH